MPIKIDIISDTVCPWCLIGKRKLETALSQRPDLDATLHWRPFQLHPDMPAEGMDRKTAIAAKFGSLENARQLYQKVSAAGKEVGITFNFEAIPRTPNTIDSHRLIHWADQQGAQDAMVEVLFRKFFIDAQDIGARDVLIAAAAEVGLDEQVIATKLAGDADRAQILDEEAQARQLGVSGVPFFIIGGQYGLSGAQPPEAFLQAFEQLEQQHSATV